MQEDFFGIGERRLKSLPSTTHVVRAAESESILDERSGVELKNRRKEEEEEGEEEGKKEEGKEEEGGKEEL